MAHITKIGALTDELVILLTSTSSKNNPAKFSAHRESALRSLRYNNYARTNQFDVKNSLEGLEEKFRVYNKDDLADALHDRLDELSGQSTKWTPEILHLLLELSDKPAVKSTLRSLEFLKPPQLPAEPAWRWEDWAAEDVALRDDHIWRNIDYDTDSSDDGRASIDSNKISEAADTILSSVGEADSEPSETLVVAPDPCGLQNVRKGQFWKSQAQDKNSKPENLAEVVTEQQAIREVLFMLQGLPTSLFGSISGNKRDIVPTTGFALPDVSNHVFYGLLEEFAGQGTALMMLRLWRGSEKSAPLLQCLQQQIEIRLQTFDRQISEIQRQFLDPRKDFVVSLAELHSKLSLPVHLLAKLSEVVAQVSQEPYAHEFRFLELLFDQTCTSQNIGDDPLYQYMGNLFFDCFQVYLRPMKVWMENGELLRDDNVFFVFESEETTEIGLLWQDRYKLRKTKAGILHAPRFLHTASSKIFTTGKSVVLLKQLGTHPISNYSLEPKLDFQTLCNTATCSLVPFPELLAIAFEEWVQSKHRAASSILRNCLFEDQGLQSSLDALEAVYFMANGLAASIFANAVFEKLDAGSPSWNDRFTLTEMMQSSIGDVQRVISEAIKVSVLSTRRENPQQSRKSVKSLAAIQVSYHLPWPVQIIVTPDTIVSYQRMFTFLIQIRRASQIMGGMLPIRDRSNADSSADERGLFYSMRSRLLWFTSTLYSYLTDVVIRVGAAKMRADLEQAEDVDQMIEIHQGYIKRIANCALLGSKLHLIHESIVKVLDLSIHLSDAHTKQLASQDLTKAIINAKAHRPGKRDRGRGRDSDSDSDSDGESDADLTASSTEPELAYIDTLKTLKGEFDHLCRFAATGLRGVARAGGEASWDVLAERLEFGIGAL